MNPADKGKGAGTDNGPDKAADMASPSAAAEEKLYRDVKEPEGINRQAMKDKHTGKELAAMAQPYTPLKLSTLERMSKDDLIDIIQSKGQQKDTTAKPRASRSQNELTDIIDFGIAMLNQYKMQRDGEPNPAMLSEAFKGQAVAKLEQKQNEGAFEADIPGIRRD